MKKKIIICILMILCLVVLKFYHHNRMAEHIVSKIYDPAPLTVVLDWEIHKPFTLQVYYTTEPNEKFNYKHSVRKNVIPDNKHVEVILPTEKIYKFLLAFRSDPGKIKLKNIEIKADQYINFNDWLNYVYVNIERHKLNRKNNSLKIISHQHNPYIYWASPFVLYKNEGKK